MYTMRHGSRINHLTDVPGNGCTVMARNGGTPYANEYATLSEAIAGLENSTYRSACPECLSAAKAEEDNHDEEGEIMTYTVRYSRATNHLDGLHTRSKGSGDENGGVVGYYPESTCAQISKGGLAVGKSFESLSAAVAWMKIPGGRNACKRCLAAAEAELEALTVEAEKAVAEIHADERRERFAEKTRTFHERYGSGVTADEAAQLADEVRALGDDWSNDALAHVIADADGRCQTQPMHRMRGVQAVAIVLRPDGTYVKACQQCVEHFRKVVLCQYSAAHNIRQVPALVFLNVEPVGTIPACLECAAFYNKLTNPNGGV